MADARVKESLEKYEKELKELGLEVTFNKDGTHSVSGSHNIFDSAKVARALYISAKLEGFKEALELSGTTGLQ